MHHSFNFETIMKRSSLIMMSFLTALTVHADPVQNSQTTITRQASNGLNLSSSLSKNIYRQEAYQENETYYVDVPYQDTETYYENVPYQDTETYTDYEEYTSSEYICRNYTDYEYRCHNVTECGRVFSAGQELLASTIQPMRERPPGVGPAPFPDPGPRPNPGPGPRPEPGPGPRPNPGPGPRPEPRPPVCRTRQVCENVPVNRQRCGYENVTHTRPVTRTRTVTRYRQEARTRTVTRYRQEARTRTVTKYRDIFDHQVSMNVQVIFPQGAELLAGEMETFKLELTGDERSLNVSLKPVQTVFGYTIVSQQVQGANATIVLALSPKYGPNDLAQSTISQFQVTPSEQAVAYKFADLAQLPRVSSNYSVQILDTASGQVVAATAVLAINQKNISGQLPVSLDASKDYAAVLKVHREGSVIANGSVDFEVKQAISLKLDIDALKSESKVSAQILGLGASAQIKLSDKTIAYSSVNTRYVITLVRKNSMGKAVSIVSKSFSRNSLQTNADGDLIIGILETGISSNDLSSYINSGSRINTVIEVNRQLPDGTKIQFWKDNWQNL